LAQNRMRDMTDDQLTDEVALGGDIAAVNEMTRRLKVATVESQEAMHHLTTWIAWLTAALAVFGLVQLALLIQQIYNGCC